MEGALRGRVPGAPQPVEDAPRLGLLFALVAQKSVFECGGGIGRIQPQRLAKLLARESGLADLQVGVRQVLAEIRPGRSGLHRGQKGGHGDIVIARVESGVSAV